MIEVEFTEVWKSRKFTIMTENHELNSSPAFSIPFPIAIKVYGSYSFINLKITATCHYYQPFLLGFLRESLKTQTHRNDEKYCKTM